MRLRFYAFLIHLLGSCLLAIAAFYLVFFIWYPAPLDKAVGVSGVVLLLVGVDVVIGPLLTFTVYNPKKKSLRFDLACILVLQLVAFTYGMATLAAGRPVWLIFNADRFDLVQAYEVDNRHPERIPEIYRSPSWTGPRWVAAMPPDSIEERNRLTFESVFAGVDLPQRADLYQPLDTANAAIRQRALPLDELNKFNDAQEIEKILKRWPEADAFLPMMARVRPMTVLLKKNQAKVIAVVDIRPWEE
jgi:type IV pilin accessory protein